LHLSRENQDLMQIRLTTIKKLHTIATQGVLLVEDGPLSSASVPIESCNTGFI
jgi:hypothetical protein